MSGVSEGMLKTFILATMLVGSAATSGAAGSENASPAIPNLLIDPVWKTQPEESFLRLFYPDRAFRMGKNGLAVISCTVSDIGKLSDRKINGEQPKGEAFGYALLKIATRLQLEPTSASGAPTAGRRIKLGARYTAVSSMDPSKLLVELVTVQQ